jgi:hypothetical protein
MTILFIDDQARGYILEQDCEIAERRAPTATWSWWRRSFNARANARFGCQGRWL